MDPRLLERLLYQEESEALDFKEEQYPFEHATDEQKGELLKDILAFANAWRQTDAYILVGIKEVRGGRSVVLGVTHHLLNRNLQQFVHSKTNRPVTFFYAPMTFEGIEIGVITIPLQDRPVYVMKPYGKLEPKAVYIRRGETTDIVKDPEELVRMGASAVLSRSQPTLEVEFANLADRTLLGTRLQLESTSVRVPDLDAIPLYGEAPSSYFSIPDVTEMTRNHNYYRDVAAYIRDACHLRPVGLSVANPSQTVAQNVIVTLQFDDIAGLALLDERSKPAEPSTDRTTASFKAAGLHVSPKVTAGLFGNLHEVRAAIGTVQPGTTAWSPESFYIGARQSVTLRPRITISADNLRVPLSVTAEIFIEVYSREISVDELLRMLKVQP